MNAAIDLSQLPLVDRHEELRFLDDTVQAAVQARSGRLVIVTGGRGVGKSRVVRTFADRCRERGVTVLQAQCVGQRAEPLLPIRDALRAVLGTTTQQVKDALLRSAPELLEGVPVIGRFLAGFGRELAAGPQIGGDSGRGLYDVLASVMLGFGREGGLCLLVEDGHVAEPDTLNFLTYFAGRSRSGPALTIVTVPSEDRQDPVLAPCLSEWEERGGAVLTVDPLARPYVREYLQAALAQDVVEEATVDFMCTFTGGNALLLTESSRQLTEQDGDIARLADAAAEIPERIRRLLEWRLRRLDDQTRAFVGAAAVVGETSRELLPILHVLEIDDRTGVGLLQRACDAGVLDEDDEGNLSFTSELFERVTYRLLRPNQRRLLHLHAGEWFDQARQFSDAAHHYERAGEWERVVPAALRAAEAAEHMGLYQSAVAWYRRVQAQAAPHELYPRLARALMVIGGWDEVERLLEVLPSNDPESLLLRSRLCFVRGDVSGAAELAEQGLGDGVAEDTDLLLQLASIHLYSGEFARAALSADRALEVAQRTGSINDQARCHIVRGACHLYGDNVEEAERSLDTGIWLLESRPGEARDVSVYSALLGNRGYLEEVQEQWDRAEQSHKAALALRSEVADAVGILESTLGMGRAALGAGQLAAASDHLAGALRLSEDLGEELQQAKVLHAMGEVAAQRGDLNAAHDLVEDARRRFVRCGTPYDVAYTDLSLASILDRSDRRAAVERRALARAEIERRGFQLLRRRFPDLGPALAERIHAGLLAYVGGDGLGLPWEGRSRQDVRMDELEQLPARPQWASGSTSDDTAITLIVAEHLTDQGGVGDPRHLLVTLAERAESIPGLGPSTRSAIERFRATGEVAEGTGNTNGAPMRALPIGWAVPLDAADERREWAVSLTRPTHAGAEAIAGACVMAACAAWAIEGASPDLLISIAAEEAAEVGGDTDVATALTDLRECRWEPPDTGIGLAPHETVAAVLHCCAAAGGDLKIALRQAVGLGGDTDTVAALVGGVLGCRLAPHDVTARLPWLEHLDLPPHDDLVRLSAGLAALRLADR
jgi:ADP-ribosylglycohydrolase/tetratricopeptide (TPR) repeat protein